MKFWRQLGLSDAAAAVLAVLLFIVGGGTWLISQNASQQPPSAVAQIPAQETPEPQAPAAEIQEAVALDPVLVDETAKIDDTAEIEGDIIAEAVEPTEDVKPEVSAPKLDLIRVSPEGNAVVAGTADPRANVVFLLNGIEVARATADATGSFVGLFDIPASDSPNSITVASENSDGGLVSDETVLVAAITMPEPEPVEVADPAAIAALDQPTPEPEIETPAVASDESLVAEDAVVPETKLAQAESVQEEAVQNDVVQEELPQEEVATATIPSENETPAPVEDIAPIEEAVIDAPDETVIASSLEPAPATTIVSEPVIDPSPVVVQDQVASIEPEQSATTQGTTALSDNASTPDASPRAAPTIVVASRDGVKVLQPAQQPKAPTAADISNVVIDTITYDTRGEVALVGRGRSEGFVRVYLNDKPLLTVPVEKDGTWETPLADVDAGVYQLRVDEITAEGNVTSRVETPFQREEVELAADAAPTAITVQPGSTLWAIAKDRFGDGVEYVRVYEANRDLIRDPDLIYPGQVFALPEQ